MTKQLGGNTNKVGGMIQSPSNMSGVAGQQFIPTNPPAPMGAGLMNLAGLGQANQYQPNNRPPDLFNDITHGAMNGLGSMLGYPSPRFHVLPELAQELSSLLYHQDGLAGLGNAMTPYQQAQYGSIFSAGNPMGTYGAYGGGGGGGKKRKSKTRRKPSHKKSKKHKKHKKRKTKYNRK